MAKTTQAGSLSGLEVRVLVREMRSTLAQCYVSNIYSAGEAQMLRLRKPGGEERTLVLAPRLGGWLTQRAEHGETTAFTTALRGELLRSRLEDVTQHDLDRVYIFTFTQKDARTRLVLELMPPGNLVVTDEGGRISLALRESKTAERKVVRGAVYAPPSQSRTSPESLSIAELSKMLAQERTVGRALGRHISLPRKYVDLVLESASLRQDDPSQVGLESAEGVFGAVRALVDSSEKPTPCLVEIGTTVEPMIAAPRSGTVLRRSEALSPLLDDLYGDSLAERGPTDEEAADERRVMEFEVTLRRLSEQTEELSERARLLRDLASNVAKSTAEEAEQLVGTSEAGKPLLPRVKKAVSSASMASVIYNEAKSLEEEVRRIDLAASDLRARHKRDGRRAAKPSRPLPKKVQREWYEKFRWFFTTGGKLALGGRDAQTNSTIVKRHLEEGDVAYHADLFGSPFFVLKGGRDQTDSEVREVAKATVSFSSAWKTGLAAADAFWVKPDQVSTTAPSGEFLARGSFAIRGKKNFVTKNPVEVAVGLDSSGRVTSGPEEAVMKRCAAHVTLVPHREKPSDTAKKVLFELKKLLGDEATVHLSVDDVLRALPAGGGKVVRRRENKKGE